MKLLAILALTFTVAAHARLLEPRSVPPPVATALEEMHWHGTAHDGQIVSIRNVRGSIRAEPATGSEIEVILTKKGSGDADDVSVQVRNRHRVVLVTTTFRHRSDVQVEILVRLPAGVRLVSETEDWIDTGASLKKTAIQVD